MDGFAAATTYGYGNAQSGEPASDSNAPTETGSAKRIPIAIIGVSGRYPKARDLDELWSNLKNGVDGVGEAKGDRWDLGYHGTDGTSSHRIYTRAGGFLDSIDGFDAEFFGMSPREARQVDPQHRLLLELSWEAMESAGIVPASLAGTKTGVFVGISNNDYAGLLGQPVDAYTNIGSALSIAANRISYVFDLQGPSMSIDTACSSSMVAMHQACTAIASGECATALVGGVNILASMKPFIGFAQASMLSPDGRCKSFDAEGNGYVRAEGGGIVILKPLDAAERDGDTILGVILGTGVNSDGKTMGMALPSGEAQERLLRQVYGACGLSADDIFYVEAHGTGTSVGDPIECGAIGRVLGAPRADGTQCFIGSIKSNIGHLEPAAGIAGLTKLLLSLKHGEIPANLHFNTPNPKIDFEGWKLAVAAEPVALPRGDKPLVFGINSFGFGGTNAHLVLQEYRPATAATAAAAQPVAAAKEPWSDLLVLSAQSPEVLDRVAASHAEAFRAESNADWQATLATAALMRTQHANRLVVQASSPLEAADRLERMAVGETVIELAKGKAVGKGRLAFSFSGNGPQWWAMGRELLASSAVFRAELEAIDAHFQPLAGWSIVEMMGRPQKDVAIELTEIAQPLLFAQQVALTAVLRAAGIVPDAVFGHSVGEAAAAHVSGALTRAQATEVIFHRSMLQAQTAGRGRMAAIGLGPEEAEALIAEVGGWLEIAAINSPRAVTVAGSLEALETLRDRLADEGKFARILPLDYAFHTSAMEPIRAHLLLRLAALRPADTTIPFISTVEGTAIEGKALNADYWWRNIRAPVRFAAAVETALKAEDIDVFVEIGPHPVLRDYIMQCIKASEKSGAVALATLRRPATNKPAPEVETLIGAICAIHAAGAGDLASVMSKPATPARLPAYPWNRASFWRGGWELPDSVQSFRREHPLLGYRVPAMDGVWSNTVQPSLLGYLKDHVVQDIALFPAAGYIELSLAAALAQFGEGVVDVETFEIQKPLTLSEGSEPIVQLSLDAADGTVTIRSRVSADSPDWTTHVRGRASHAEDAETPADIDLAAIRATMPVSVDGTNHYLGCDRRGLHYGPWFRGVKSVLLTAPDEANRAALGQIDLPELESGLTDYRAHPSLVDSCLQVLITLIAQNDETDCATIPERLDRIRSFASVPSRVFCHVSLRAESARSGSADMVVTDENGTVVMLIEGARFRKVQFRAASLPILADDWRPDPNWRAVRSRPLHVPAPADLAQAALPAMRAVADEMDLAGMNATIAPRLTALVGAYAAKALRQLGAQPSFTIDGLARAANIATSRSSLLRQIVAMAAEGGTIMSSADAWTFVETSIHDPEDLRRQLMLDHPGHSAELVAIGRAGEALAARLTSDDDAAPAIAMREALEDTSPTRLPYNRLAAEFLRATLAAWPSNRPIRILELEGSTGGLAASLLPVLSPERSDYLFTDASEQAVTRAANRFGAHHFLRTAVAAVDQPLESGFDIVVSAGSPSAADLNAALVPGGLAIVVEAGRDSVTDLLFGSHDAAADLEAAGFEAAVDLTADIQTSGSRRVLVSKKPVADAAVAATDAAPAARRVLVVSAAEAETGLVAGLRDALAFAGQDVPVRAITAADLDDAGMAAFVAAEPDADEFIHLAGFANAMPSAETVLNGQDMRVLTAILLARAIEQRPLPEEGQLRAQSLTLVTRGGFAGPGGTGPLDPFQAPLAGIGRVMPNEHGTVACRVIDVHAAVDDGLAGADLAQAILTVDDEAETLLIDGQRYVSRVRQSSIAEQTRIAASAPAAKNLRESAAFRLDFLPAAGLDSLHLRQIERRKPGAGEIEIKIHAAGLNFRDVLWAMGMLPEDAVEKGFSGPTIGMECAGEIVAVGAGVENLKVGDRVIAFASSCFASHVTTKADCAAILPDAIGYGAAATIPTAFVTAWYALDYLARLEPGETVLIHGAAGGVGLAALQICKLKGAVVIASAGSADKQKLVRTMGADHVVSSRSLKFADDIMRLTDGKGVDVVLNSLAGEAITKGLQVLKPFGRFLEIGKRDLYGNSRIGLRPFRQNLSYFGIDADTLLVEKPVLAKRMFDAVVAAMANGDLKPLPYLVTPISRAAEAFRAMQQARHVGKLVVSLDIEPTAQLPVVWSGSGVVRADATYVVTGGLGGFGLATAEWLAAQGARSLALLSRRGDATDEAREGLARLRGAGVDARAFAVDVADRAALEATLGTVRADMAPIKGVVHAAAVIDDAPLMMVQRDLLHRVMSAKMIGAWNLHEATLADGLESFVLYSSSSAVVGNPGQGAYVAANLFLDSLAEYRRAQGLAALSIGWGAIKDAGFLTRNAAVEEMLEQRAGMEATPVRLAMAEMAKLMASGACRVAAAQFNLMRLGQNLAGARSPRFSKVISQGVNLVPDGASSIAAALEAMGDDERRALILSCVTEHVGRVVGSSAAQIEVDRSLTELGLDSLMAVELAEALEQAVGRPISVMQMIQAGTVGGVVNVVLRTFGNAKGADKDGAIAAPQQASIAA
jgi:phthiocerol/phenolphthiocerol synthesis type-I polyketide synthase C